MELKRERWYSDDYSRHVAEFEGRSNKKLTEFQSKLIPGAENVLGIYYGELKGIAKQIAAGNYAEYLMVAKDTYFETVLMQAFVIGFIKGDIEEIIQLTKRFIPKIDNWAVCDSFCMGLKIFKKHRERALEFILPYLNGTDFEVRFALVSLMSHFMEDEYLDLVLKSCDGATGAYYVKMAVAWTISTCFVKFPQRTENYLKNCSLDKWTYNKALQKIIESNRVDSETKDIVRQWKRG